MRRDVLLPLALLFIAHGIPSNAQNATLVVDEGAPLTVECALRVEQRAEWRLDGGAPPADLVAGERAAGGGLAARLQARAARPQHAGLYTCARGARAGVRVVVRSAGTPSQAPASTAAPADDGVQLPVFYFEANRPFTVNCTAPRSSPAVPYVWKKNGTAVTELWDLKDRFVVDQEKSELRLTARATEDDWGTYTCEADGGAASWRVLGQPHTKLPPNTNVVEGQKLKLVCKLVGKPYSAVRWTFTNATLNMSDVSAALGERVKLAPSEQGVAGAELELEAALGSDAGEFECWRAGAEAAAKTRVRVKDMYAALWPFLGICAEVFVLCAIILLYEKRRTKPELDDSDTDNHDQKKS